MRVNIGTVVCEDTGETVSVLKHYLNTLHWRRKKLEFKKKMDMSRCFMCHKEEEGLIIRHRHYKSLGRERMGDLMALCIKCDYVRKVGVHRATAPMFTAYSVEEQDELLDQVQGE